MPWRFMRRCLHHTRRRSSCLRMGWKNTPCSRPLEHPGLSSSADLKDMVKLHEGWLPSRSGACIYPGWCCTKRVKIGSLMVKKKKTSYILWYITASQRIKTDGHCNYVEEIIKKKNWETLVYIDGPILGISLRALPSLWHSCPRLRYKQQRNHT